MERLRQILAAIVSAVVVMTTVMQFHHHDGNGAIFIKLFADTEVVIGAGSPDVVLHCDHGTSDNHLPDDKDCSMHFDKSILKEYVHIVPTFDAVAPLPIVAEPAIASINISFLVITTYFLRYIFLIINSSSIFRAPPCLL